LRVVADDVVFVIALEVVSDKLLFIHLWKKCNRIYQIKSILYEICYLVLRLGSSLWGAIVNVIVLIEGLYTW
jgi:hypothetical protein